MLKYKTQKADLLLLFLFLLMAAVILLRINAESTGYLSPDSRAYLELAQNLKDGHGFYVMNAESIERDYFSTWPVGYPVLVYLFSEISRLDVYWASKALNLLLLACGFLLLRHICLPYSFVLASIYGAYTFMEVYSFTWSEAPFLLGILLLAYFTNQVWRGIKTCRNILLLFLACLFLFLIRYVGAFSFGVPALLGLYYAYHRQYTVSKKLFLSVLLLVLLAGAYLYTNYTLSGFTTGFDRLEGETESVGDFALMLATGLLNEILIIRKFRYLNQPDYLFYATTLIQLLVFAFIYLKLRRHYHFWQELQKQSFSLICLSIGFLYFATILLLRTLSHFDDLDYRLLSPLSFPILIGLTYVLITLPDSHKDVVQAKYSLFALFVLSLLLNMPKHFILAQLQQLF